MATKTEIDFFLSDPDYLALVSREREHRLLFITRLTETRVSAFLGWLFNPQEGHGLSDQAFRELLRNAWRVGRLKNSPQSAPTPRELQGCTFSDLLVYAEFKPVGADGKTSGRPIDLVMVSRRNKLVVAIENKFGSKVHSDQLLAYKNSLGEAFPSYERVLVYLDSNVVNEPDDEDWITLDYTWLIDLVTFHQAAGMLSTKALDALGQVKDYLTDSLDIVGQSDPLREGQMERIFIAHPSILEVFQGFRKESATRRLQNVTTDIHEPLLIEYYQRYWLWDEALDEARHAEIVIQARRAFPTELEVESSRTHVRMRLKSWSKLEINAGLGHWGPRVVAWRRQSTNSAYDVWGAINFEDVRPDLISEVRNVGTRLRDESWKPAHPAVRWMRLGKLEVRNAKVAGREAVEELRRINVALAPLLR